MHLVSQIKMICPIQKWLPSPMYLIMPHLAIALESPAVAEHMDPNQHVMIYCVEQAIKSLANTNINKERTAVITGIGAPGQRYNNVVRRGFFTKLKKYLRSNPELNSVLGSQGMEKFLQEFSEYALEGSVPITEDTAPGILQNIMAARITNLFDFSGPAYTVDAACASTLAATISGVLGLLEGNMMY